MMPAAIFMAAKQLWICFILTKKDFCPQVDDIISVGQFYEMSGGAQIIFT